MKVSRITPAHFGIYVYDIERMVDFYTSVFDLTITDDGVGKVFGARLVFLSATPDQHHQLVLCSGRSQQSPVSTVMQISFIVPSIEEMRHNRDVALQKGATEMRPMNHGNAWSLYYADPEGNRIEVYMDTPFYVNQPYGSPLDIDRSEAELLADTEAMVKGDPSFLTNIDWRQEFLKRRSVSSLGRKS